MNALRGDLADDFPGWRVWRARRDDGSPGSWYATRISEWREPMTLVADTPDQLARQLDELAGRQRGTADAA